jgi:hypothetical protein
MPLHSQVFAKYALSEAIIISQTPKFVQFIKGDLVFTDQIELEPKLILKPKTERQSLAQSYVFDSEEELEHYLRIASELQNLDPVFKLVKTIISKYIDTEDHYLNVTSC